MPPPFAKPLLLPALIALVMSGCASQAPLKPASDEVDKRLDAMQAMLDKANERIEINARWLHDTDARGAKAGADQEALSRRLDAAASRVAATDAKIGAVAADVADAGRRIDANASALAARSQRINANAAAIADAAKRVDGIDGRVAALDSQSKASPPGDDTARLTRMEGELAALKASLPSVSALVPITPVEAGSAPVVAAAPAPAAIDTTAETRARLDAVTARIDANTRAIVAATERLKAVEDAGRTRADSVTTATVPVSAPVAMDTVQSKLSAASQRMDNLEMTLNVAASRIETTDRQVAEQGERIKAMDERVGRNERAVGQAAATAQEALARAQAAGKLAQGKLVYAMQLSDETAPFALQSAALSDESKQILTALANKLKAANEDVYLEIQGHTDNSGSAEANQRLAMARAEAVRDYLHDACGLPLHRLSVVAYGASHPLAGNDTQAGRTKNRRVEIIVLN